MKKSLRWLIMCVLMLVLVIPVLAGGPPGKPKPFSPSGNINIQRPVTFKWVPAAGATGYEIAFYVAWPSMKWYSVPVRSYRCVTFLVVRECSASIQFTNAIKLPGAKQWYIRATNAAGASPWIPGPVIGF